MTFAIDHVPVNQIQEHVVVDSHRKYCGSSDVLLGIQLRCEGSEDALDLTPCVEFQCRCVVIELRTQ
jgi:hypothetical protein